VRGLTDINGLTIAVPVTRELPLVQEMSIDIDMPTVPLYGENNFAIAVARKGGKISGKIKFAGFNTTPLAMTMAGITGQPTVGGDQITIDEAHTVPATPFQFTISPPNSGVFSKDLGVKYNALTPVGTAGVALQRAATATGAGVYAVNEATGIYTFQTTDATALVVVSYRSTVTTGASQLLLAQEPLGNTPSFELTYSGVYLGSRVNVVLSPVVGSKLALASKLENWNMPELDFEAFESTGIVGATIVRMTFPQA
jgi:hypothetical protein